MALGATPLGIDAVVQVARGLAAVSLDAAARRRLAAARTVIERFAKSDVPVYGLTTGLGAGVDTRLAASDMAAFQAQAIRARSVGVGARMATDGVRAMLLARLAGFAAGRSGVSPHVAEAVAALLNARIHPLVPATGSIGAADLAPLAHAGLVLLGQGLAEHDGEILDGAAALAAAGLKPPTFGTEGRHRPAQLQCRVDRPRRAGARRRPPDARCTRCCGQPQLRRLPRQSQPARPAPAGAARGTRPDPHGRAPDGAARRQPAVEAGAARRVQDPLQLPLRRAGARCRARCVDFAIALIEIELNGAGDNPVVLAEDGEILSGPTST